MPSPFRLSVKNAAALLAATLLLAACDDDDDDDGYMTPPSTDTTPPSVTLEAPDPPVSRTVALTATASDNVAVTRVDFIVDGAEIGSDTSAPYGVDWDTSTVADGEHMVLARAYDEAGNTGDSDALQLEVDNERSYTVTLSGQQEVPPVETAASGEAMFEVNLATGAITGMLTVEDVAATAAHIHDAFAGTNGSIIVPLVQDASDADVFAVADGTSLTAEQVDRLLAGALYVNAHSQAHPGGEIRAQLFAAPVEVLFTPLSGDQAVPPVETDASGLAATTVNRQTGALVAHLHTSGVDDATMAHLHRGEPGVAGPVVVPLVQDEMDIRHWFADDATLDAATLADYADGLLYANVHTPAFPDGEIRGQILPPGADPSGPPEPVVTLSAIQDSVFSPRCAVCHNGVGASLPGSLNLSSAAASHAALVGVASLEVPELLRVAPGDPDNSYLVHKLEGSQAVGSRMPLGGPFLSEAEIGEVRQWIESGALND